MLAGLDLGPVEDAEVAAAVLADLVARHASDPALERGTTDKASQGRSRARSDQTKVSAREVRLPQPPGCS